MNIKTAIGSNWFKGLFYSLAGTVFVSTNYVTAKYALQGFNAETFSLIWCSAAAFYALLVVLATGHGRELILPASCRGKVILLGLATGAGMTLGWAGLKRLDPSLAAFLWRLVPLLTIVLSAVLLHERLSVIEIFAVLVMVFGGCVSTVGNWQIVGTGVIFIVLSCSAISAQLLIAKALTPSIHTNILVFYRVALAAVLIAGWLQIRGTADFDVAIRYWSVLLLGAFLGPCLGFLLTFRSYRYWDLSRSAIVNTTEPLYALLLAYLFLHRLADARTLAGGIIILAGAFWLAWMRLKHRMPRQETPPV